MTDEEWDAYRDYCYVCAVDHEATICLTCARKPSGYYELLPVYFHD